MLKVLSFSLQSRAVLPALLTLALAACASSDVASVTGAAPDRLQAIRVSEVVVTMETPKPNPLLEATLRSELEKAMPQCARGSEDHRMEVAITDFEEQDVGKAIMIGDEIELEGRVRFIDPATETLTGEYFVENSFYWGGFIGAAMMSDPERRLSRDFAKNVCAELFGVELGN